MRRRELIGLSVWDIDAERGTVGIRQGKGRRDRMVPIGERAASWVGKYSADVRPGLVVPPDAGVLFLPKEGLDFTPDHLSGLVTRYVERPSWLSTGAATCSATPWPPAVATVSGENRSPPSRPKPPWRAGISHPSCLDAGSERDPRYAEVTSRELIAAGFTLLPTFSLPHYSIVLGTYTENEAERLLVVLGPHHDNPHHVRRPT
jgi:hypothetical protein